MRARVTNPTNSPLDLNGIGGLVRLPAMGFVEEEFSPHELQAIRQWAVVQVEDMDDKPAPKKAIKPDKPAA